MRVDVVTIFPDYLAPLGLSLVGRARERGLLDVRVHDLRDWAEGVHRSVDDAPFGGGAGMVMAPEPWGRALDTLTAGAAAPPLLVIPTPAGRRLDQRLVEELVRRPWLVIACGRYEGIDARVADYAAARMDVLELSLGDYVLAGGEVAALALVEAVARLLPGVLGNPDSVLEESHAQGLLEHPAYTRPPSWRGLDVPPVLLSGDHAAVTRWRRDASLRRTARTRPELLAALPPAVLDERDRAVLAEHGPPPDDPHPPA